MKVILSGGGSGGHISPALAIAAALKQENPSCEILFVGAVGKMEMEKVPLAGYVIIGLPIRSLKRGWKSICSNSMLPFRLLKSLWQARKIIRQFRPNVVIGTGGYASFPIVYMAAQAKIPVLLQEQNAIPGLVNSILAKYATKIGVAYENMEQYFGGGKVVVTGNPVCVVKLCEVDRAEACAYFGLSPRQPVVLVLGGSQGAATINDALLQVMPALAKQGIQVLLSAGPNGCQDVLKKISKKISKADAVFLKVIPYIVRMDLALVAADVVVSRAGALAITEIGLAKKPAIFIPSPNVVQDHQTKNILPFVEKGAAIAIQETKIAEQLGPVLLDLVFNESLKTQLAARLHQRMSSKAAEKFVALAKKVCLDGSA